VFFASFLCELGGKSFSRAEKTPQIR